METILLIFLIVVVVAFGISTLIFSRKKPEGNNESLLMLQNQINELSRTNAELGKTLDVKLGESTKNIQIQFSQSFKVIQDVTERLTKLDETNRQVVDFAEQLQSLQDILKNPKQRGILGEYYLETVLKNVLPPGQYEMQKKFKDGTIVDAVVYVKDKIIPIDSKFSLENYNRLIEEKNPTERERLEKVFVNDLKLRIVETSKYIQPKEGTQDFAFMFIPHEAIYYDLLTNKIGSLVEDNENLIQRAMSKYHVVIVSPTSFLAYLQTVLQGLRALQIEETAKEIRKNVEALRKHLSSYQDYMKKMGKHLGTTVGAYNDAYGEFGKIDKDVLRITEKSVGVDKIMLEGPTHIDE